MSKYMKGFLAVIAAVFVVFAALGLASGHASAGTEVTPTISNLTHTHNAASESFSFDWDATGQSIKGGDTFTVTAPAGVKFTEIASPSLSVNGAVVANVAMTESTITFTFTDAINAMNENVKGGFSFKAVVSRKDETHTDKEVAIKVGTETAIVTRPDGPGVFESVINKYNLNGEYVYKDFKIMDASMGYPWINAGDNYIFTKWFVRFNGDGKKAPLTNLVVTDKMNTPAVDYSGIKATSGNVSDVSALFSGPYIKSTFGIAVNGQYLQNVDVSNAVKFDGNGFTLNMADVGLANITENDVVVLEYATVIPKSTIEVTNAASYTSDENPTSTTDTAFWRNSELKFWISGDKTVTFEKVWEKDSAADRPSEVVLQLLANGEAVEGLKVTLNAANNWTASISKLPGIKDGNAIVYSAKEVNVPEGYTSKVADITADGKIVVTNTGSKEEKPETTKLAVEKKWKAADGSDLTTDLPASVTVQLTKNGTAVEGKTLELNAANSWKGEFTDLEKADGVEYSVKELTVDGYKSVVTLSDDKATATVTNTKNEEPKVETTKLAVEKKWKAADGSDLTTDLPASVTVQLTKNGTAVEGKTLELNAANSWKGEFTDLEKADGVEYSVKELTVDGYKSVVTLSDDKATATVTNTKNEEPKPVIEKTKVEGEKVWKDADNQDGKRPDSVTIKLFADGVDTGKTAEATKANNWKYSFADLDKTLEDGKTEIKYTVEEVAVEGYTPTVDGYTITNTYKPETVEIPVSKVWNDADNQDGIRPSEITVKLLADGKEVATVKLSEANDWKHTFTDLPKNKDGKAITYVVDEEAVENYSKSVDGNVITNTYTPKVTNVAGEKVWKDDNNRDGIRPEKITVTLLADGKEVASQEVSAETDWKYNFENLPVKKAGKDIVYTVKEVAVKGYTSAVAEGNAVITNTHEIEKTKVTVSKEWYDGNNADGIRPESVTVRLWANGVATDKVVVLNKDNKWTYTFTDLPKNENGSEISYMVVEDEVKGYSVTYMDKGDNVFVIQNSHEPTTPPTKPSEKPKKPSDKPKKDLPSTGETASVLGALGLAVLGGTVFVFRRQEK